MNWKEAKHKEDNIYELPGSWLKIEYFEALNILFRVENSLRVFVYIILKDEYKDKWKDLSVTSDDSENSTIGAIAKKRIAQDKNYAYLGYTLTSPMLHLTSGELIRIITSDSYWKLFKKYFLGSKEIMKNKLDEIGNVRNSLAHFRPVKKGDIELVKQNSIHTLSEIENVLTNFIKCTDNVPTNTDENWYKNLMNIGTEECKISFRQDKNEEWIRLILTFTAPVFSKSKEWPGYNVRTLNLKSDKLLSIYSNLSKFCISAWETVTRGYVQNPEKHTIYKTIEFTFGHNTLKNHFEAIKTDFENIFLEITKEINLIEQDNLARGKLIESAIVRYHKDDNSNYYNLKINSLCTDLDEDTPVEFWGTKYYAFNGFITSTEIYPWMTVPISEDKGLPF